MNIYNDLFHGLHLIIYVVPDPSEGFRKLNLVSDTGLSYLTELMQCIDSKIYTTVPSIDKYIKSVVEAVPSINRKRFRSRRCNTASATGCFGSCAYTDGVHPHHLQRPHQI